ncbi:hypothetical protein CLV51_102369 [Chitinophaga niastensis]|uniref:PE-PGRS family protein n=1 Tax=Chitinophaga niastensis TaxID=536980 RepID=A0A2P8HMS2_CHINA|nr:hypothetical protein [Chitinophaga niastensis]PSL47513.1 hypothetical protein CLV51_102369 [Chitinophaga niastensis]
MRALILLISIFFLFTAPSLAQSPKPQLLGNVVSDKLTEASGIASSTTLRGCYWTHNDSGNKPEVFLINSKAALISTIKLDGVSNRDWEDIAEGIGPVKGKYYVYVGDIGDNYGIRKHIRIYRFAEPEKMPAEKVHITPDILTLSFPNGARDAESLMIDPISKQIYIISKRERQVSLYKTDRLFFKDGDETILEKLIKLPYTWVTAGDISKDGHHIVIKTLTTVYYWHRNNNESVEQAMAKPAKELPYVIEKQGEGITITPDNDGYVTISEGENTPVYYYKWKF